MTLTVSSGWVAVISVGAVGLSGCAAAVPGVAVPGAAARQPAVEWVTDPESDSTAFVSATLRGDGLFVVGKDFPTGVYSSAGSASEPSCDWAIFPDSGVGTVTAGGGSGPQHVAIVSPDSVFVTRFCQPWRLSR